MFRFIQNIFKRELEIEDVVESKVSKYTSSLEQLESLKNELTNLKITYREISELVKDLPIKVSGDVGDGTLEKVRTVVGFYKEQLSKVKIPRR